MFKRLSRIVRVPSSDPKMVYISRPLPRDLPDEDVVAALELAFQRDPDPRFLVETLRPALREVTGRDFEVLDRSFRDVTGRYQKLLVMIRDGDVGHWPGYDAMAYPMLAPSSKTQQTRAAIADAAGDGERPPDVGERWRGALGSGAAPPPGKGWPRSRGR
jgi:hypothetical protein